jgi:hypothetical protein
MLKINFLKSILKFRLFEVLKFIPLIIKYKFYFNLCKFDIHPKKIFSHRFKNLYSIYEVHICKICLKQIVKKVNK